MQVGHGKLDRRSIWWSRKPEVEILTTLLRFEEKDNIAGVEVGEGVEEFIVARGLFLRVQFRLFVRMW